MRFVEYGAGFLGGSPRMRGLRRRRMRRLHQPSMLGWRASHGSGGCRPPPPVACCAARNRSFPRRPPAYVLAAYRRLPLRTRAAAGGVECDCPDGVAMSTAADQVSTGLGLPTGTVTFVL